MTQLSLYFLGGFEATLDAEPITAFGSDKARALLAFLAIESARPHRRAKLSGMFWPDLPENKAAHNLSQSLLRIRQALGRKKDHTVPPVLIVTPQHIQFNSNSSHQLDVARFRELLNLSRQHKHPETVNCMVCAQWQQQAAELYHGNLLDGLFLSDSLAFEEWRMIQQEDLRRQALDMLTRLSADHEQRGELEPVQNYARRLIALDPWREEAHLQLMRVLAQSGQTTAALMQYELYQRTLSEELNLTPSADITALYEKIRSGEGVSQIIASQSDRESVWLPNQGERRQITTLVCNRHTLDDFGEEKEQATLCDQYCGAIFNRFGGRRAQRQGNVCLVYFGYPQAYEDAARRAVHSVLALASELEGVGHVRVGIHTGVVTVGEKHGQRWQDRDLFGVSLEIARDCQRLAKPGEILITEDTRRLVQEFFDLQALEPRSTTGQSLPVYYVRGESSTRNRLEWLAQTQRLTTFTGREESVDQLTACYKNVIQGKGQVVLLSGEPGIGKSRLIWELKTGAHTSSTSNNNPQVLWLDSHCLPHYQNTSLYPMIGLLEGLIGIQADDSLKVRQEKLAEMLDAYNLNHPSANWLLSLLLGLSVDTPAVETVTKAQREQMREAFIALFKKRAAVQPLVLVIEDLHWSDPSTIEWLDQSLNSLASVPCLTLLTARPGFNPAWLARQDLQPDLIMLRLNPLQPKQAEAMVSDLAKDRILDENICQAIVAKTDGVPLFLEELTKALLERPPARTNVNRLAEIPATLLGSLIARLDHLGTSKETAQWAAALGREFSYSILQACVPYDAQRLQADLARLIESELVSPLHTEPQTLFRSSTPEQYTFKHILAQEAAYTSMLKDTRQAYHQRIAKILETCFPKIAAARPELLAQHYFEAGMRTQAIDLWLQAGEHARSQSATLEARTFFDRAIELIEPADGERLWRALKGREEVFDLRGERDAQNADLTALMDLAETFDDDSRRSEVYLRQTAFAAMQGNLRDTLPLAEAASLAARRAGNLTLEIKALAYKAQTLIFFNDMAVTQQVVKEILAKVSRVEDESVRALVLTVAAYYFLESGDLVSSVKHQRQSSKAAQRAGNLHLELEINANLGLIYATLGLYVPARTTLEAALARCELLSDRRLQASIQRNLGCVYLWSGEIDLAQQVFEQALSELNLTGDTYGEAACLLYLGCILERAGDLDLAAENLAKAIAGFSEAGVDPDRFETQSVMARVALAQGRHVEARQMALDVWNYLSEHGTEGISSSSSVYSCIANVLDAVGETPVSSREVIEAGYGELMRRAEKISNPKWRRSFLENVVENREILDQWKVIARQSL